MNHILRRLCTALLALLLAGSCGCVRMEAEIAGTPTPAASPTPLPEPFQVEITAAPVETDAMGRRMETENHFFTYYLSFGDMRVYEYDTGTFLDGVVVNSYLYPLKGSVNIVYYDEEGRMCGTGTIHTASGDCTLASGSTRIYAEIYTDISVQDMDFVLEVTEPFTPVTEK